MPRNVAFLDIDTQADFMRRSGALYVPGAEVIIPNLQRLIDFTRGKSAITLISTADAHKPDSREFRKFPPHCIVGTVGQKKILETVRSSERQLTISDQALPEGCMPERFLSMGGYQFIFEKDALSIFNNPNFLPFLMLCVDPASVVVFGVATEYCVKLAVLSLLQSDFSVTVVLDAIRPVSQEEGLRALEEMKVAGATFCKTDQILQMNWE